MEAALCTLPGIVEAAALAEPDATRGEEVLAVLQHASQPPGTEDMADFVEQALEQLADTLATFKHPRYWVFVDDYPRTPSNKVQKPLLRDRLTGKPTFDRAAQ
ncbi:MAG: AMP-dependent synthetase, partial [Pseudomonadota bacterium]